MRKRALGIAVFIILSIVSSSVFAQSPQISSGLSWLYSAQTTTGYWPQVDTSEYYSTTTALDAVYQIDPSNPTYSLGIAWLTGEMVSPTDYLSRRIIGLKRTNGDVTAELEGLIQYRNPDSGWGGELSYLSSNFDTALAVQALKAANYTDSTVLYQAINFLTTNQNSDGGWGFRPSTTAEPADPSNAYVSAIVLRTLAAYDSTFNVQDSILKAKAYLLTKQNTDGGFGSSPSTVYETALSVMALIESGQGNALPLQNAINYLTSTQSSNGSWNDDPYSTALALQALAKAQANLSISSISFSKTMPQAGEEVTIIAAVKNSGLEDSGAFIVRFYQGDPVNGGVQIGTDQVIASLALGSSTQVSITESFSGSGSKTIFAMVDPDNSVSESVETDNSNSARIFIATAPDLAVYSEDLKPSTYIPIAGTAFTLSYNVRNLGESEAGAFTVSLYDGDHVGATHALPLQTINVSGLAGTQVRTGTIGVTLTGDGAHTLYLVADTENQVTELSETNNMGSVTVQVGGAQIQADLAVSPMEITLTPSRPIAGETIQISAKVRNQGQENAFGFTLEFYDGSPDAGGTVIHTQTLSLAGGAEETVTADWTIASGIHDIYIIADRANKIVETDEQNNRTSIRVMPDMVDIQVSASNLAFTPARAVTGDTTVFTLTINNTGIIQTGPFNAALYDGPSTCSGQAPESCGTLLQTFPISNLPGDGKVTLTYTFTAEPKTYRFYVVADTENAVAEMYETNNQAIRSLTIKGPGETYGPDLVPVKIDLIGAGTNSQTLTISGNAQVTFQNKGDAKITTAFDVLVFEDKDKDGGYTSGVDNLLGTGTNTISLWPEGASMVIVPLTGTVNFLNSPLYAMIDSGDAILEQDEANNLMRSGSDCENRPANEIEPVVKWSKTGIDLPGQPVVVNLNGKFNPLSAPAIVYTAFPPCYWSPCITRLYALDGKTGDTLFDVSHRDISQGNVWIAAGDIDGDGYPEIIAPVTNGSGIRAYRSDGSLKWDNTEVVTRWDSSHVRATINTSSQPIIADIDGNGIPEIITGATVINGDGSIRFVADYYSTGGGAQGFPTVVADLDLDGKQEIVSGRVAFNSDSSIKWWNPSMTMADDGLIAIGNFDDDPYPEIVVSSSTRIHLLDHNGHIKWGPIYIHDLEGFPDNWGIDIAPPVIADFDGDGESEIGIRGLNYYFILDKDGEVKKALSTPASGGWGGQDRTAPAVFDLNGDRVPEVLMHSDGFFRIFNGREGNLLYSENLPSRVFSRSQGVIIADVDGNGHAEAVLPVLGFSSNVTMRVYRAKNNDWVGARSIWNQWSYHVTNVNDDGTIPQYEAPSWLLSNTYNSQARIGESPNPYLSPNLTSSYMRVSQDTSGVSMTVRIGNGGAKEATSGAVVSFYDGDPTTGVLIGSALTTGSLKPGDYEDISFTSSNIAAGLRTLYAVVDKEGSIGECNEADNQASMTLDVKGEEATFGPDLVPVKLDLSGMVTDSISLAVSGIVNVTFQNKGDELVNTPFDVIVFEDMEGDGIYTQGVDNLLGAGTSTSSLWPNYANAVSLPLSGKVKFLHSPLYAMIDVADSVLEQDEANNVMISGSDCENRPTSPIQPMVKWSWKSTDGISVPGLIANVIDTNGDGKINDRDVPAILFESPDPASITHPTFRLQALRGDTGVPIFTISNPVNPIKSRFFAVGDIDNDGRPEIILTHMTSGRISVLAYNHDGTLKWDNLAKLEAWLQANNNPNHTIHEAVAPVIADIDADGMPEIIMGLTVLNSDGSVKWGRSPFYGSGNFAGEWISTIVADIDMDGKQDIIAGNTVYNNDGTVKWHNGTAADGITAIGDIDSDGYPEVVLVTAVGDLPRIFVLEHDGKIKWGPVYLRDLEPAATSFGMGGPPVIADFDGDGKPEIGVKGSDKYFILGAKGDIKKTLPIPNGQDGNHSAPTVFDLNGDGRPEVLIKSDGYFRIFDGRDGILLYEEKSGGHVVSGYQNVIVADVDGDSRAEAIVVGHADYAGADGTQVYGNSIKVYRSANNDWVNARRIWNQADYHVTNVNDDGTIPQYESPSWLLNNSFRCQAPASASDSANPYLSPNLTVSAMRAVLDGTAVNLSVRIGNGGAKEAAAGAVVTFSDSGTVIGTASTTKTLLPGEYQDILLSVNNLSAGIHQITAVVNADNTIAECNTTDNQVSVNMTIVAGLPDLAVGAEDIVLPAGTITEGSIVPVTATIRNIGAVPASGISVRLYNGSPSSGGEQLGTSSIAAINAGSFEIASFNFDTLGKSGINTLYIVADQENSIIESNESNNIAPASLTVQAPTLPNLAVSSDSIQISPVSPSEGEALTITATVTNRGAAVGNVPIEINIRSNGSNCSNSLNGSNYTETKTIYSILSLGQAATVQTILDTTGIAGEKVICVEIDPANTITESSKDDNSASKAVFIQSAGLASSVSLDKATYQANEAVAITISASNSTAAGRTLGLNLAVLDTAGNLIAQLTQAEPVSLDAGAAVTIPKSWNTGKTLAGNYSLTAEIAENTENSKILTRATANFTIAPDKSIDARAATDKISYNANETAAVAATVTSLSPNYVFEKLSAKLTIGLNGSNSLNGPVFVETKTVYTLMPEASFNFKTYWNTGTYASGTYPVTLEVKDAAGTVIATGNAAIVIAAVQSPSKLLKGQISVDKQSILSGDLVNINYTVTNSGNMDLESIDLRVRTVHAASETVYDSLSSQATLSMSSSHSGTGEIDTLTYSAKDYLVVLSASINGVEETLAGTYFRVEGAPTAPSVAAPVNGSDVLVFAPSLILNNASDPNDDRISYEFELYADSGFADLIAASGLVSEQTSTTGWTVTADLEENASYYWRARAYDGKLYSPWMDAASFRVNTVNDPPTAPIATSPGNETSVDTFTPALTVTNASDPDSGVLTYNFEVAFASDFDQVISAATGVISGQGATAWQAPLSLDENAAYYWRAQADDGLVQGPWSAASSFFVNTANDAPTAPVITSPVNASEVTALEADIIAMNSTDPDSPVLTYFFDADTVMTFDSPGLLRSTGIPEGQGATSWQVSGLLDNSLYYLRAKASDGSAESAWSGVSSFFVNTVNDAPSAPVLANPSDGAGVNVFTPSLSVFNAADIDRDVLTYEFEVYDDAALTRLVTSAGIGETDRITSWIVPVNLAENETYYWRARAFDGELSSAWMPAASFMVNTANDAPSAPGLSAPAEGESVPSLTPTLAVVNATDPDSDRLTYDFEIYTNGALVQTLIGIPQDSSGITTAVLDAPLSDNTAYQWRTRAFDGDGYGPWMSNASFTVHVPKTSINATIDFDPDTLNTGSKGTWVTVYIELPEGYNPADIDVSSVRLEGNIPAEPKPYAVGDDDKDGIEDLMVKFKRSEVVAVLPKGENVNVHVTGKVGTITFEGIDVIRVMP